MASTDFNRKNILSTIPTAIENLKTTLQSWANGVFSPKGHTHTKSEITNLGNIGTVGLPNWTRKQLMNGTSFTCPADGWIFLQPVSKRWTKLNGITIAYAADGCGGDQIVFPVSKNDVVMITNGNNGTAGYEFSTNTRFDIRYFVPFK